VAPAVAPPKGVGAALGALPNAGVLELWGAPNAGAGAAWVAPKADVAPKPAGFCGV